MDLQYPYKYVSTFALSELENRLERLTIPVSGLIRYSHVHQLPLTLTVVAMPAEKQLYKPPLTPLVPPLTEDEALAVIVQLLRILLVLHHRGICHGRLSLDCLFEDTNKTLFLAEAVVPFSMFPTASPQYERELMRIAPEMSTRGNSVKCFETAGSTNSQQSLVTQPWGSSMSLNSERFMSISASGITDKNKPNVVSPCTNAVDVWGIGVCFMALVLNKDKAYTFDAADVIDSDIMSPLFSTLSPKSVSFLVRCFKSDPMERPSVEELLCELSIDHNFEHSHVDDDEENDEEEEEEEESEGSSDEESVE
eukprot:Tbor_TRINITY_DN5451_c2_g1::TRINITY_DN5451_c2_g1_i1::g.25398::m.25398